MTASDIRRQFLDFFKSKGHVIVPSAPIVVKNDPTLLFINSGMAPFKDALLGNQPAPAPRVADTQKCLRVSGKHNDLEEVGVDTYHHTMFEMLGNWSFGDYFKKEAIDWSWELLTDVYGIPKDHLYVTVFGGDETEGLARDEEALALWKQHVAEDRIIFGNKKDNFWEMGDTGPCGPCTEIHVDTRTAEERKDGRGGSLVNADHPQVIEIWNNVFMQFNRVKDGSLHPLPAQHVDTGMGFERLVRVLQGKQSNYDTDVFSGTIAKIESITAHRYTATDSKADIAFRVIADHIRAIAFTIADGQLPSNTGAGYVIRRILRRAVRYYYSYLNYKPNTHPQREPLLSLLVSVLAKQFSSVFPELDDQKDSIALIIREEENSFLRTLEKGLDRLDDIKLKLLLDEVKAQLSKNGIDYADSEAMASMKALYLPTLKKYISMGYPVTLLKYREEYGDKDVSFYETTYNEQPLLMLNLQTIDSFIPSKIAKALNDFIGTTVESNGRLIIVGAQAFELFDTYGFPIDLTRLVASEFGIDIDEIGFEKGLQEQKTRSRAATALDTEDWVILKEGSPCFIGYDSLETKTEILRYRKVKAKGKESYQIVLAETPFYAESGGQVGDTGEFKMQNAQVKIFDTKKENDLIIHFTESIPDDLSGEVIAAVDIARRASTEVHHSATHLLHAALRCVLGKHVAQKGSLVNAEHLRFDFSHFSKMTDEEITAVERMVNEKIRENIPVVIRSMSKDEAVAMGAMALFGEKYGDIVRVVMIDPNYSIELCGGTHVGSTGQLGFFKIKSEGAVAAGVRRIEAVSGAAAETLIHGELSQLRVAREAFKNPKDIGKSIEALQSETAALRKQLEAMEGQQLAAMATELSAKSESVGGLQFVGTDVSVSSMDALRKLAGDVLRRLDGGVVVLTANINEKASVAIALSDAAQAKGLDAGKLIKEQVAPLIKGGGGGQKGLATAGGTDAGRLAEVIATVRGLL